MTLLPAARFEALPRSALAEVVGVPFGIYVHVPFCASRCGYCAFNTYTTSDLGGRDLRRGYAEAARREISLARAALGPDVPPVSTVFFGGGTPTALEPAELVSILAAVQAEFPTAPDLEVTVEANPDSVDRRALDELRAGGVTRLSFGMQSARAAVLAVLERSHTPGAATRAVRDAHAAGFEHVSLDLIYGTPGETDADWQASLDAAIAADPDHVSAYALTIEPRTRLAAQVRRGLLPEPDEDVLVRRYDHADDVLAAAGYGWYELSNWARSAGARCRHNVLYWHNHHWWGIGPGAHSHVGGTRWWNLAHPDTYAASVAAGRLPVAGHETLDVGARVAERVLLGVRLADGFALDISPSVVRELIDDGLVQIVEWGDPPVVVLSRRGRSLADLVARRVIDATVLPVASLRP